METFKNAPISIMLNKSLVGKAPPDWARGEWRNYYRSFKRTNLTPYVMAGMVWQGYSFTPCYAGGRRLEDNFDVAYHMAFDFDEEGAALDFLMRDMEPHKTKWGEIAAPTFAKMFSSFAYSTPSSTPEHPKSRVVFIIPNGIHDPQEFRQLYQAIAAEFEREGSKTDPSCKDPLRLYYGSERCNMRVNWSALLPNNIEWLTNRYVQENPPPRKLVDATVTYETDDDSVRARIEHELNKVVMAVDGEKHNTLNKVGYTIGGFVGAGHLSESEAVDKLDAAITANGRADNLKAARATIEAAVSKGAQQPLNIEQKRKKGIRDLIS